MVTANRRTSYDGVCLPETLVNMVTTNRRTSYDGVWLPKTLVNTVTVNRSLTSYNGSG